MSRRVRQVLASAGSYVMLWCWHECFCRSSKPARAGSHPDSTASRTRSSLFGLCSCIPPEPICSEMLNIVDRPWNSVDTASSGKWMVVYMTGCLSRVQLWYTSYSVSQWNWHGLGSLFVSSCFRLSVRSCALLFSYTIGPWVLHCSCKDFPAQGYLCNMMCLKGNYSNMRWNTDQLLLWALMLKHMLHDLHFAL